MVHPGVTSTDARIDVHGGSLFVRTWRPAEPLSEAPLILLHDSLGCVALWRDFPAILAAELRRPIVAYDRLGFGRSTAKQGLPSPDFVREEAEVMFPHVKRALGVRPFALFGHSVGGSIALSIAAGDPDCQAVVSESAQPFIEARTLRGIGEARRAFEEPGRLERLAMGHGDKARWVLESWTEVWSSPGFADWTLAPILSRVACPVLAIHGDRDEYGSRAFPETICRLAAGPCQIALLEGCGHTPHRERKPEVLVLVGRFLARTLRAGSP